ncbi:MAG: PQQ-binding-like beta-propeller repeat protein [Gemmataceae bacterium]|nr:PQQ-binding-like beta-propeller repeat protein [Gemmataceae bacterium]
MTGWGFALLLGLTPGPALALDSDGVPLPPGAVARLGTTRYRVPGGSAIALSPDGRLLAVRTPAGVDVLDLSHGRTVARLRDPARLTRPHQNHDVSFVFTPDSKWLLTVNLSDAVSVWDPATGRLMRAIPTPLIEQRVEGGFKKVRARVRRLVCCPDGPAVLAESWHRVLYKLDVAAGRFTQLATLTDDLESASRDGRWITESTGQASIEDYIGLRDLRTGKLVLTLHDQTRELPYGTCPSPDGKLVAAPLSQGIAMWDVATQKRRPLKNAGQDVGGAWIAFSPDGKVLFSDSPWYRPDKPHLARWDTTTGERLADWPLPDRVTAWEFDARGGRLIVLCGSVVRRFDLRTGKESPPPDGFRGSVTVALSWDGKRAAAGDSSGLLRVWATPFTGASQTLRGSGSGVCELAFAPRPGDHSPDSRLFATYSDRSVGVWDLRTQKEIAILRPPDLPPLLGYSPPPLRLKVSADGRLVVCSLWGSAVWMWDVPTGKVLWMREASKEQPVKTCPPAFAPDGSVYLGLGRATVVRLDSTTGRERQRLTVPGKDWWEVGRVAVSPNGRLLATHTSHNDGCLAMLDLETGKLRWQADFKSEQGVGAVTFNSSGRWLLTTHRDGRIRMWEARTGQPVHELAGPMGSVWGVQVSGDGRLAITDAPGATALIWSLVPAGRSKWQP